jgi:hypothetical protein
MTAPVTTHRLAGYELLRSFPGLPSTTSLPPDRRGRLRNGARPGDFLAAPRCGAGTRAGGCCRQPAMRNGRCRLHGGLSTGPRTAEGRARCARARLKHGFYSAEMVALRRAAASHCRRMDAFFATARIRRTAGHGLLPQNLANHSGGKTRTSPTNAPAGARSASSASLRLRGESSSGSGAPTAGRGVLRSFLPSRRSARAIHLLGATALRAPFSAGHGVLRSFSPVGPVPAGMVVQPARQFVAAGVRW